MPVGEKDAVESELPTITAWADLSVRRRSRVTLRRLMVLVAVVAACLAWMRPTLAPIAVVPLLIATFAPGGSAWKTIEVGAAWGWLIGAAAAFSEIEPDLIDAILFFWSGAVIGLSWSFRIVAKLASERPSAGWWSFAVVPVVGYIGFLLLVTDRDFDLRLRLSEPALRAAARTVTPGSKEYFGARPRRFGLFWARGLGENGGAVYWHLPGGFLDQAGVVYVPGGGPPKPWGQGEIFSHLRGPWWRYVIPF